MRESEERYRALFEQAADAIVVFDPETLAIIEFNEQACRQLGYTRAEFARLRISDFDLIESSAETKRRARRVAQNGTLVFETRHRRKDGALLNIEVRAKTIHVRSLTLIQAIWHDITKQKHAERGLATERNLLRTLIDHLPDGIYVKDLGRRFLLANEGLARIMGAASPDDLLGGTDEDFYPAKFSKVFREDERRILKTGRPLINKDEPRPASDGTITHVLTTKIPLKDANGSVIGLVGIGRDITERKRAEEALRVSEERLKFAFRASREGVWDWNLRTDEVFYSAGWKEMLGYQESEIEPHVSAWKRLLHPDDVRRAMQLLKEVRRGERDYVIEFRLRHKDGHYVDVVSRGFPVRREPGGPIIRIVGTHFDLTERKQAEAELRESERRYRLAVDFTYDWEYWLDPQGRFIYVSPSCERISGHTPAEFEAKPGLLRRLIHPSDRAGYDKHVCNFRNKCIPGEDEWRIQRPDGTQRWIAHACQPVFDEEGECLGTRASNRDITKRKEAEEALRQLTETLEQRVAERTASLRESNEKFRLLFATVTDAVLVFDAKTRKFVEVNDAALKLYGYNRKEFLRLTVMDLTAEPKASDKAIKEAIAHKWSRVELRRHKKKDGTVFPVEISASTFVADGKTLFCGVVRDITERMRVEEALRASEERLSLAQRAGRVGVFDWNLTTQHAVWTPELEEIFGLKAGGFEGVYEGWSKRILPDDLRRLEPMFARWMRSRQSSAEWQYRLVRPDGEIRWIAARAEIIRGKKGRAIRMIGTNVDITGSKKAEEAITQERQLLRTMIDLLPDQIYVKDTAGRFLLGNTAIAESFGKNSPEKIVGHTDADYFPAGMAAAFRAAEKKVLRGEPLVNHEQEAVLHDGRKHVLLSTKVPLRDARGRICGLVGIAHDITESKQAEEEIRASRAKLQTALASMTDAVFISDAEGNFIEFNDAFATFHKFKNKQECGKKLADYPKILEVFMANGEPASLDQWAVPRALRGETGTNVEYSLRRKDTGETWVGSFSFAAIRNQAGAIVGSVVVGRDITERKQLEREIVEIAEQERRHFGRELHDDICQQLVALSMVSETIAAQFRKSDSPGAAEIQRISEMLGETLRSTRELSRGLHPAGFDSVGFISALRALAEVTNLRLRCRLNCAQAVSISNKHTALQLYRIAQEAVSNALKHAGARKIVIGLRKHRNRILLTIADDGIGLPARPGSGLGMRSMSHRARMIGATLLVQSDRKGGTRVVCALPVDR